jgi:hypothetical protein
VICIIIWKQHITGKALVCSKQKIKYTMQGKMTKKNPIKTDSAAAIRSFLGLTLVHMTMAITNDKDNVIATSVLIHDTCCIQKQSSRRIKER